MVKFRLISEAFARTKKEGRLALVSYFVYGYPSIELSQEIIELLAVESDLVEIGFLTRWQTEKRFRKLQKWL